MSLIRSLLTMTLTCWPAVAFCDHFPLAAGYEWTYRVLEQKAGDTTTKVQVSRNLDPVEIMGAIHTVHVVDVEDLPPYKTYLRADASGVFSGGFAFADDPLFQRGEVHYYIRLPAVVGTTWKITSHTFLLSENHPVEIDATVSRAGYSTEVADVTYDDCIDVTHVNRPVVGITGLSVDWVDVYCDGVGMVRSRYEEKLPGESGSMTMELVELKKP